MPAFGFLRLLLYVGIINSHPDQRSGYIEPQVYRIYRKVNISCPKDISTDVGWVFFSVNCLDISCHNVFRGGDYTTNDKHHGAP